MTCVNLFQHTQVAWPSDPQGQTQCPFDDPIRRTDLGDPSWYWGFVPVVMSTGFDDVAREAHEYDLDDQPIQVRAYTEEENARADAMQNASAVTQAQAELARAVQLNSAPEQLAALQNATLASEGIQQGDPWRQPTGAHDAYPLGAEVSHNGKNWTSTIAANVWEPGVTGWSQSGGGIPDWVQPTGAQDAYALGAVVRHNALVWQSTVDANVWEPGVFGWQEIPDPEA